MAEYVQLDVRDQVAAVTLNRPDRLNGMIPELLDALLDRLEAVASDGDVRVVVLTGAGKGFCVGGDLAAGAGGGVATQAWASGVNALRRHMRSAQLLHEMDKVTIAAINGACAGAGLSLACACDLRFAAEGARFSTAFLAAGVSGDFGGTWTLPRIVGPARARDLYLVPQRFGTAEAKAWGLVSRVVEADALLPLAWETAQGIVASAPLAVRDVKRNLNDALRLSFPELLDREAERHIACTMTADAEEAAVAFLEKRAPAFTGR